MTIVWGVLTIWYSESLLKNLWNWLETPYNKSSIQKLIFLKFSLFFFYFVEYFICFSLKLCLHYCFYLNCLTVQLDSQDDLKCSNNEDTIETSFFQNYSTHIWSYRVLKLKLALFTDPNTVKYKCMYQKCLVYLIV